MLNALYMVLGGMAIVFSSLALVWLVMVVLGKVFKPGAEAKQGGA